MVRATRGLGGAEVYNLNLIKGFRRYFPKTELIFLTTLPYFAIRIKEEGARVKVLPVFSEEIGTKRGLVRLFFALPKYLFYYLKEIIYFRINEKIKIVCLQGATEKIVLTPLLHILGFKVIWIEHGPFFAFPTTREVFFLYRCTSKFVKNIITYSRSIRTDSIEGKLKKENILLIKAGIDTEYFCFRKDWVKNIKSKDINLSGRDFIIGYLGDICEEKGMNYFVKVAKIILEKNRNIIFIFIGKGNIQEIVKQNINYQNNKENYKFVGFQKDVANMLSAFDILFYPIKIGGLPFAIMEAMAMEKVVVTRDVGGNRELVLHGRTGFLFKDESPEEVADLIIRVLKDKKLREKMGKAARARIVKYFNLERWSREMHEAFLNI